MWNFIVNHPIWTIVIILAVIWTVKYSVWLLRYFIQLYFSKTLKYMRITLPREDTQKDKDKQTEKDFKEKIGV